MPQPLCVCSPVRGKTSLQDLGVISATLGNLPSSVINVSSENGNYIQGSGALPVPRSLFGSCLAFSRPEMLSDERHRSGMKLPPPLWKLLLGPSCFILSLSFGNNL